MRLLTNLLFEPKGMHNQNAAYNIKDTVMSGDGSRVYFAIQDVPAGIPLNDSNYWKLQIDLSGSKSAMDQALASFADYAKVIGMRVRGETAKASGNPVTFLPDAGSLLQPVTVLEPQQQGSGEPSPENVRPLIGYDKLELRSEGKNILDVSRAAGEQDNLHFVVNADGSITINGTAAASGARVIGICIIPNGGCVFSQRNNGAFSGSSTVYCEGTNVDINIGYSDASGVIENAGVAPVRMWWAAGTVFNGFVIRVMAEIGTQATEHMPYDGNVYTVQIGETVYGGKFDWLTGRLAAEWGVYVFPDEENNVYYIHDVSGRGTGKALVVWLDGIVDAGDTLFTGTFAAEVFLDYGVSDLNELYKIKVWQAYHTGTALGIMVPADATAESVRAKLAGTKLVYKLANPIEIQLTPHIISAADPEQTNTLYGDGRIEVEYVKPLHVSIEERVAAAVAAAMQT